jgi:hypothetical protein
VSGERRQRRRFPLEFVLLAALTATVVLAALRTLAAW